jgi:hypothetical protein
MARVKTGKKDRPAWGADGGTAVGLLVACALGGHPIEVWRLDQLLTIHSNVTLRDVVAQYKYEVGWTFFCYEQVGRYKCGDA